MIRYGGVQLKGCICELKFGYNAKTVVYTKSSSDISKLGEMVHLINDNDKYEEEGG